MGRLGEYIVVGSLSATLVIMIGAWFVMFNVSTELSELQELVAIENKDFKEMADEAWHTMIKANAASRRSFVMKTILRQKRGYVGGDSYMDAGGSECQCAVQASGCPQGPPGPPGQPGHDGEPGGHGQPGGAGLHGAMANSPHLNGCIQCPAGPQGPPGPNGNQGAPGPNGNPGQPGSPSSPGAPGPVGPAGPSGNPGRDGHPGQNGQPGAPGTRQLRGSPGLSGAPGPMGPPGPAGAPAGDAGPGAPGPAGPPGLSGRPGHAGQSGPPGGPGPNGVPGPDSGYCKCPPRSSSIGFVGPPARAPPIGGTSETESYRNRKKL